MTGLLCRFLLAAMTAPWGGTMALEPGSGESWNFEVLDSGIQPTDPSIRIDSQGYPHIAYLREDVALRSTRVTYAHFNGSSWESGTLVEDDQLKHCYFALDNEDAPCIVFQSGSKPFTLRYAVPGPGGSWSITEIASSSNYGHLLGVDTGSDGCAHVLYLEVDQMSGKEVHHLYFNGSVWVDETAMGFSDMTACWGFSLVLDSQNEPRFCGYMDWAPGTRGTRPFYTVRSGGSWSGQYLGAYFGDRTDIVLTLSDQPRVVFQDDDDLLYASFDGLTWDITQVDPSHPAAEYCALAPDGSDTPPVAYHDSANDDLRYAWCDGSVWNSLCLDSEGEVGTAPDVAVDSLGNPFILYNDVTNHQLKLAWFGDPTGMHGPAPGESPRFSIVEAAPNPTRGSLAVTLSIPVPSSVSLSVYDLGGRLVRRSSPAACPEGLSELVLEVTGLDAGVYLVRAGVEEQADAVLFTVLP